MNAVSDPAPATRRGGELIVDNVSHHFASGPRRVDVLQDVSFTIPPGAVACVVGPSGCGKSTLLNLSAGLAGPAAGELRWDGDPVRLGQNRDVGMAFQQPGLFPWMTVERNVAVGLRTRGHDKRDAARITAEFLETVGLTEFKDAYPTQLSGGMAQRVGIARALALQPRLLLLDEPFAAVDAFTRLKLQQEFKSLLKLSAPTVMFVTHDVPEAISLGDFIVVMSHRPASVVRIIEINREDRDRSSAAYAHKLSETLECLGVTSDMDAATDD
ncbi:NitT/TauT family transport system ATP-binding protein [Haloactinopolyspora alba]|uniref:NitT/TauT family transport system ATP-binding protein n=1 Tax=Haloactinopolyspora alba TaxID=648780 RepID=A0A2P8E7N0_9ACTN|nr:ABC transporter ATP-binding protein [Haloactinopolyspora alba]PSL05469.1 NitT/TauT family transport system ATP-binding protein [Haloactinopolyspora alba]